MWYLGSLLALLRCALEGNRTAYIRSFVYSSLPGVVQLFKACITVFFKMFMLVCGSCLFFHIMVLIVLIVLIVLALLILEYSENACNCAANGRVFLVHNSASSAS